MTSYHFFKLVLYKCNIIIIIIVIIIIIINIIIIITIIIIIIMLSRSAAQYKCKGMSPLYAPRNINNSVSSNIRMYLINPQSATDRNKCVARVTQPGIYLSKPFKL